MPAIFQPRIAKKINKALSVRVIVVCSDHNLLWRTLIKVLVEHQHGLTLYCTRLFLCTSQLWPKNKTHWMATFMLSTHVSPVSPLLTCDTPEYTCQWCKFHHKPLKNMCKHLQIIVLHSYLLTQPYFWPGYFTRLFLFSLKSTSQGLTGFLGTRHSNL